MANEAFWDLDGPVVRITTPHIPLPAAEELEDLAIPSVERIATRPTILRSRWQADRGRGRSERRWRTMKAAVYHDRRDVRVEDVEEPSGPADGEVLVAPLWCGICGTDVHEYTDGPIVTPVDPHPLTGATNPQVLGHEFSAEVLEVGGGVTNVRPGTGCR